MIRKAIALVASFVIVGAIGWASLDHRDASVARRGDQLGMESGENFTDYAARAERTHDQAPGNSFALVTFDRPGGVDVLDRVSLQRVNAAVSTDQAPVALPEPVGSANRSDVIHRWARGEVTSVVVYDSVPTLVALAEEPGIAAVEILPGDAVWGRFGIRPVIAS